uniref:EF-hand domain-containing protein n=1 Tax=Alexandrium monilatum TaxID=311494 RepID=A0A7S4UCC9_9DINO
MSRVTLTALAERVLEAVSVIGQALGTGDLASLLQDERCFDPRAYDNNGDGTVTWWEFCVLWKEEQPSVRLLLPERVYLTMENPEMSKLGRILSWLVLTTIFISAGAFILSTLPVLQESPCEKCEPEPLPEFSHIDTVCVIVFTIEYLVRLVTAAFMRTELPILNQDLIIDLMCTDELIRWPTKLQRTWDFVRAPPNLIDLAAVLPSYVAWCLPTRKPEDGGDSSMVILKLIRLMRVVRAFRLGRRFEAVIIIARSMQRSTRALWVLVLNMTIGTVVFGAVMFFVEQGTYEPYTQRFTRPGSWALNTDVQRYERAQEDSPFESIPHAFWWALVTATTAGYGDMSPTTLPGKVTAGICMIWSLCVIALPVGVIGSTFESVWEEYDTEKSAEREMKQSEARMSRSLMDSIDPMSHSSLLRIEVYHDFNLGMPDNDTFVGEAEAWMNIDPSSAEPVDAQLELPLRDNHAKSDARVSGRVYLEYSWAPAERPEPGVLLRGRLTITLLRAEDLVEVDWKTPLADFPTPEGCCDPYVVVTLYPSSPSKDGALAARAERSSTVFDSRTPTWLPNERMTFDFDWRQEGVLARRANAKRALMTGGASAQEPAEVDLDSRLMGSLPQILADIAEVRHATPELAEELSEMQQVARSMLTALGISEPTSPASRHGGAATALVHGEDADAGFQFVVPGMIAEELGLVAEEPGEVSAAPSSGPG